MIKKVISSGQEGAEQGGLASAFLCNIETGGYCPKGFKTIDSNRPDMHVFGLKEIDSDKFKPSVEKNIEECDSIIFIGSSNKSKLEQSILDLCNHSNKPLFEVNISNPQDKRDLQLWMIANNTKVVYVTGKVDRAGLKGTYKFTQRYLEEVFKSLIKETKFIGEK